MKKKSINSQIYIYQILEISIAIILALAISLYFIIVSEKKTLDRNISNTAYLLSESSEVKKLLSGSETEENTIYKYIDNLISELEYIDVVTICNSDSIRYYHSNKDLIGKKFEGGDEKPILNELKNYLSDGSGTLGEQRRAFSRVTDGNDNTVGFVMVSILTTNINQLIRSLIFTFTILGIVLILLAIYLSWKFNRRLHNILLGYNPEEFRKKYIEREEVLNALEEGIFAINTHGEIILMNESAKNMLGLDDIPPVGTKLVEVYPETMLPRTVETSTAEYNVNFIINGENIISSRIPIVDNGKTIGAVSIFRNKTEVTKLAEELTGARYMVDTLRAFNHEFKNKLHVILGYIKMGKAEEVTDLILSTSMVSTQAVSEVTRLIQVPEIAALLIGKIIRASELGIKLTIKPESSCFEDQMGLPTDVYLTLLGNLLENAIEELNKENNRIKEIEVGINIWSEGCIISVDDTGSGIPDEIRDKIFAKGFSTKSKDRGMGMYLIKDIIDRYNGVLQLDSEEGVGTSFTITITKEKK